LSDEKLDRMKLKLILLFLVLCSLLSAQNDNFKDSYIKFEKAFEEENYEVALKNINVCIKELENEGINDTTYSNTLFEKGDVLYSMERYTEALTIAERAFPIEKKVLGEKHIYIANSYDFFARIYLSIEDNDSLGFSFAKKALELRKELLGDNHPEVALGLNNLAQFYFQKSQYEEALPFQEQALELYKKSLGEVHPDVAYCLNNLSQLYSENGQFEKAFPFQEQALELFKKCLGDNHPDVAMSLNNLAQLYSSIGQYEKALPFQEQALIIYREVFGEEHLDVAMSLYNLAGLYSDIGQYDKAIPLYENALKIKRKLLGKYDPSLVVSFNNIALLYSEIRQYEKAQSLYEKALKINRKVFGEEHLEVATSLNNLANFHSQMGQYKKAQPLYEQALKIRQKLLGKEHPDIATSLNNLAFLFYEMGQFEEVQSLYEQSLKIYIQAFGQDHPEVATSLNNLAIFYSQMGQYEKARSLIEQSLEIRRKVLGKDHSDVAASLSDLALLYSDIGQYEKALAFNEQALKINRKVFSEEHYNVSTSLNNLGILYFSLGQYDKAQSYCEQALIISKKVLGEDHPDLTISLNNLALIYSDIGQYEKAQSYFEQALKIVNKLLGKDHPKAAIILCNLASLYHTMGQYEKALELGNQALEITREVLGEEHTEVATILNNLARIYSDIGQYEKANLFSEQSLKINRKVLGNENIELLTSLSNLALHCSQIGQFDKALSLFKESLDLTNKQLTNTLPSLSEDGKIAFVEQVIVNYEIYDGFLLSTETKFKSPTFSFDNNLFLNNLTLRSNETMRSSILNSSDSILIEDFQNWQGFKRHYANAQSMSLDEIKNKNIDIKALEDSIETKERSLSLRSQVFQTEQEKLQLNFETVKSRLGKDEAFLMFHSFDYYNGKSWTDSVLYTVFVVCPNQKEPLLVELFEQSQLDSLTKVDDVFSMMDKLYQPSDSALYNLVWKSIAGYLGDAKKVYIAPSGQLHKLAFAAIGDGAGHVLSDKYEIHQVLSAQDFVYPSNPVVFNKDDKSTTTSIALFGGIKYEQSNTTASAKDSVLFSPLSLLSKDLNRGNSFEYLPATQKEIESIQSQFNQNNKTTLSYSGSEATEASLRSLEGDKAPKILHIATHGYFAPDPEEDHNKIQLQMMGQENRFTASDNPLLRSGLMMAGSNASWKGTVTLPSEEDGILTAQEVSNLNLLNTQLVVLSACETGLGDIKGREGVFGLQRAFRLAGAKYLLLSLWSIPDEETSEYMQLFYAEVLKQNDISKAYKTTQSSMRQKYPNSPMKWAGMVLVE
jgi:tetratricopeptide (TPR) repeat protein/CHAT domain-containing protein